jgi:glycosyltransferase involved in cell wall biosynthesis
MCDSLSQDTRWIAVNRVTLVFQALDGGVQRSQVDLANALLGQGAEVSVVMARAEGPFLRELVDGVELVDLQATTRAGFVLRLAAFVRRRRPSQVIASQHHTGVLAAVSMLLAARGTRLIIVLHNHLTSLMKRERWAGLVLAMMRLTYRRADTVVCVSRGVAGDVRRCFPKLRDRVATLYYPIPLDRIVEAGRARTHEAWLDSRELPVVVAVGRLCGQKDFATLLRAISFASRTTPCRLVIVGEGEERARLEAVVSELGIEGQVRFAGHRDNPHAFVAKADVVVVSSRWEGFCLVIVEALALGRAVVSTDCPSGPAEILDGGRFGRLVPVGDSEQLAEALIDVLQGRSRFPSEMLRARAAEFSTKANLQAYLRLLGMAAE